MSAQIGESIQDYTALKLHHHTVIFGGVKQGKQVAALKRGVDIVVATPGRLLDLIDQGYINLSQLEYFVLDEADTMLDMGFIHDIRKVIKLLPFQAAVLVLLCDDASEHPRTGRHHPHRPPHG